MTNFTTGKWKLLYSEHPEQRQIVEMLQPVGSSVPRLEDKIALRYGFAKTKTSTEMIRVKKIEHGPNLDLDIWKF